MNFKGIVSQLRSSLTPSQPRTRFQQDIARAVGRAIAAGVSLSEIEEALTIERVVRRHESAETQRVTP